MKELLLVTVFILLMGLTSCATRPPIWYDELGILHREEVSVIEVDNVKIVNGLYEIPNGCLRLRNIYFDGTTNVDWGLKRETAKQYGTHVIKGYYNGVRDTLGVAYDCNGRHKRDSVRKMQRAMQRNALIGERERRAYERGNNKERKPTNIPTLNYYED
jgi:hypothetical protein